MKKLWTLFILVFIVLFQKTNSGTICLSCNNLAEGELCAGNEVCKNDEVCFIQKYTTNGNENRYDVGCAYPELCQKDSTVHVFGRRSDHSHVLCHKCCNNTDVCNAHLSCNDKISVPMQKCLSCSEIEDPKMCKNETTCAKDEICYLHKYTTHTKQQLFDVGCKHSSLCTQGYSNILGRRSSDGVHQECESCCSGAVFCNHDLQCNHVPLKIINNTCSTTNECIGNLVCLNGTCKCESEQFYWGVKTCYKRQNVNERCTSDHQCKQSLSCEQNICKCVVNKFWNGSLCEPKKTIHLSCSSSDECLDTLYCNHGYCKCDASVDYWNGSACLTGKMYNESCSDSVKCRGTFSCINNKCSCLSLQYLEGSQCLAWKTLNDSCGNSHKCQVTLSCINFKCSCLTTEYWDGSQCLTRKTLNDSCGNSHKCQATLSCINFKCSCLTIEYWDGSQCLTRKTLNDSCGNSHNCQAPLSCINFKCTCLTTEYWDGSQCLTKKSFNSTCNANEQCKHNYRCIDKICRCTQAAYLNDTQCLPKKHFNSTCYINEPCRKPLRCINNVCKCLQAEYWNGTQCVSKKLECEDVEDTRDGVYTIYPGGGDMAVSVYCIMGQAKKWTVIQTRSNGSVDFNRNWQEYRHGFGSVYGAYWLGNDNIHMISTNGHHEFSIYMQAGTEHRMANYSTFSVGDERSMYRLTVTGYSGDAGDSMDKFDFNYKANEQLFTTKDRDNDKRNDGNCAVLDSGGWWFNKCYGSQFNRQFDGNAGNMYWATWRRDISKSILMIRRTS